MHTDSSPFLQSISNHMIVRRYSKRTIETYVYWIKCFIVYHDKRHPTELDSSHVEQFLTFLAVERKVAAATQKIVLNAMAFLFNKFLDQPLNDMSAFQRARTQQKIPVVLTRAEVAKLFSYFQGTSLLIASLLAACSNIMICRNLFLFYSRSTILLTS